MLTSSYSFGNGGHLLLVAILTARLQKVMRICNPPTADTYLVGRFMISGGLTCRISTSTQKLRNCGAGWVFFVDQSDSSAG